MSPKSTRAESPEDGIQGARAAPHDSSATPHPESAGQPDAARHTGEAYAGRTADRDLGRAQVDARRHLMAKGASDLPRPPWLVEGIPHDDATLIRYALWRANSGAGLDVPADLYAALELLESARAEMDALETGVLFVARAEGLTWAQIADHLGVRSPQAAQQRFERVSSRTGSPS